MESRRRADPAGPAAPVTDGPAAVDVAVLRNQGALVDDHFVQRIADARAVRRVEVDPIAKALLPGPIIRQVSSSMPFEEWAAGPLAPPSSDIWRR